MMRREAILTEFGKWQGVIIRIQRIGDLILHLCQEIVHGSNAVDELRMMRKILSHTFIHPEMS
jgi:hypothetical protein